MKVILSNKEHIKIIKFTFLVRTKTISNFCKNKPKIQTIFRSLDLAKNTSQSVIDIASIGIETEKRKQFPKPPPDLDSMLL